MRIGDYPAIVVVWTQEGCPACQSYLPKFQRIAARYEHCLPSAIVDCDRFPRAAQAYRIGATPTTMLFRWGRPSIYSLREDASPADIETFFRYAASGQSCDL